MHGGTKIGRVEGRGGGDHFRKEMRKELLKNIATFSFTSPSAPSGNAGNGRVRTSLITRMMILSII